MPSSTISIGMRWSPSHLRKWRAALPAKASDWTERAVTRSDRNLRTRLAWRSSVEGVWPEREFEGGVMVMGSFRLREPGDRDYAKRRRQMTRKINPSPRALNITETWDISSYAELGIRRT